MVAKLTDAQCQEVADAFFQSFSEDWPAGNKARAARILGVSDSTYKAQWNIANNRGFFSDQVTKDAMSAVGAQRVPDGFWAKVDGYSCYFKKPKDTEEVDLRSVIVESAEAALQARPKFLSRKNAVESDTGALLVIDVADVHFGKLSVATETGHLYGREAATQRVLHGVGSLLKKANTFEIHRILFVLGDDVLHVDNAKNTTTSGTPQDTEGSVFQMYRDAFVAFTQAIEECAKVADVDLIHVPSNHDWILGWALSQQIAAWFKEHPHIHSTPYNLSERHRKYYRYGSNLIGLSHGDGAKEQQLYACMVTEAREHISDCKNLYWLLHHVHHKVRKRTGLKMELREKDHIGMTMVTSGDQTTEGQQIDIEYVRSPSPPDSWHDRNGFVNRQAVECFLYHPHDGQVARLTEYF